MKKQVCKLRKCNQFLFLSNFIIEGYKETKDRNIAVEEEFKDNKSEQQIFERGQSKRIWGELYKVCND